MIAFLFGANSIAGPEKHWITQEAFDKAMAKVSARPGAQRLAEHLTASLRQRVDHLIALEDWNILVGNAYDRYVTPLGLNAIGYARNHPRADIILATTWDIDALPVITVDEYCAQKFVIFTQEKFDAAMDGVKDRDNGEWLAYQLSDKLRHIVGTSVSITQWKTSVEQAYAEIMDNPESIIFNGKARIEHPLDDILYEAVWSILH